jgi:hypothetical protein
LYTCHPFESAVQPDVQLPVMVMWISFNFFHMTSSCMTLGYLAELHYYWKSAVSFTLIGTILTTFFFCKQCFRRINKIWNIDEHVCFRVSKNFIVLFVAFLFFLSILTEFIMAIVVLSMSPNVTYYIASDSTEYTRVGPAWNFWHDCNCSSQFILTDSSIDAKTEGPVYEYCTRRFTSQEEGGFCCYWEARA